MKPPTNPFMRKPQYNELNLRLNISGGSRGGTRGSRPPPLFLDQTKVQRAEKNYFLRPGLPLISGSRWPPPSPLSEGLDLPLNIRYNERLFSSLSRLLFRGSHVQFFFSVYVTIPFQRSYERAHKTSKGILKVRANSLCNSSVLVWSCVFQKNFMCLLCVFWRKQLQKTRAV